MRSFSIRIVRSGDWRAGVERRELKVMEAVPVVAGGSKSATEDTKKICEEVKCVTLLSFLPCAPSSCQKMKESCKAYEEIADRAVRLLAPVANAISKANSEKLTGMERNVLFCVLDHAIF
jgi:hypothetical protein